MQFDENKHPRARNGRFTDGNGDSDRDKQIAAIRKYSDDPEKDLRDVPIGRRIKVGEITNPIYDSMVLSDGRKVKDIITRVVEMPLTGSVGAEHIEKHSERKGMVSAYIGVMNDIINDPDYVFEDKINDKSLIIGKKLDNDILLIVSLNYDKPNFTNTLITMWSGDLNKMEQKYEKIGKVLYKRTHK